MKDLGLVFMMFIFLPAMAQVGPDKQVVEQLKGVCKVWGFLKYYSNSVDTTGSKSWNMQLQKELPGYYKALDQQEYNSLLKRFISVAEKPNFKKDKKALRQYKKYQVSDYNNLHFDWIDSTALFDAEVKQMLHAVINNFQPHYNNYLAGELSFTGFKPGNIQALQKNGIDDSVFTTERMLNGLFTIWNLLYYTYPYNDLICMNYDSCITTFIPEFINVKDKFQYACACHSIMSGICDSHSYTNYVGLIIGYYSPPVELVYVEGRTLIKSVPDSLEKKYHLRGCEVIRINDTTTEEKRNLLRKYLVKARPDVTDREVNFYLTRGAKNTVVDLLVSDGTNPERSVRLQRNDPGLYFLLDSLKVKTYPDSSVYYINAGNLKRSDAEPLIKRIANARYLIIDYRQAFGNMEAIEFQHYLQNKPVNWMLEQPMSIYPGKFYKTLATARYFVKNAYKGKMIILVNSFDQSSDEFGIDELRYGAVNPVILVGSNTAGACGEVNSFSIYRDMRLTYTGQRGCFTGQKTFEKVGLQPDIYVEPTIAGIRAGKDEVLERALEYIKQAK